MIARGDIRWFLYSTTAYFSYSQLQVFDSSVKLPGVSWTDGHFKQGFARQAQNVSFGTRLEFGHAEVAVYLAPYKKKDAHERAIEVPFEVISGEVVIGGPEEYPNKHFVKLPNGHYRLVAAQQVTDEDREVVELFMEKVVEPLTHSRVIVADEELDPPDPLIETVEVA